MAFYALGYRYVFQKSTEVVRNYIINSFDSESDPVLTGADFALENYENNYYEDPLLHFVVPHEGKAYLLVSFLKVGIRLPFAYRESMFDLLKKYMQEKWPDRYQKVMEHQEPFLFQIFCTKTHIHSCFYDELMAN